MEQDLLVSGLNSSELSTLRALWLFARGRGIESMSQNGGEVEDALGKSDQPIPLLGRK